MVVISLDGFPAYDLDDPKLPIPTLRSLIENGVSARMATVNPTVTWPNHTAMVTGVRADEHGLLANGTILRTGAWPPVKVEPMIEKEKMVHVPTVYDAAYKAGLTTAQVDWVAINQAPYDHMGVQRMGVGGGAGGARNDRQGGDRRFGYRKLREVEHPVPRPDLDQGRGLLDPRAPAQPAALPPVFARFRAPPVRAEDTGGNCRDRVSG